MQHRVLVRHRRWLDGRITSIKCTLRNKLAHYNSDIAGRFTERGRERLANVAMNDADRHEVKHLEAELELFATHQAETDSELAAFGKNALQAEREAREVPATIPQAAWRLANNTSRRWFILDTWKGNTSSNKKAIAGVARRQTLRLRDPVAHRSLGPTNKGDGCRQPIPNRCLKPTILATQYVERFGSLQFPSFSEKRRACAAKRCVCARGFACE